MALSPLEMVVIAVVAIIFLMFGPKKIPELARSIGLARKEFAKGSAEGATTPAETEQSVAPAPSSNDALRQTAQSLGISTEGRTSEQISADIVKRAGKQ